jgi:hypothetical protein
MAKYEQMQSLFTFFKVPNNPFKHRNDCARWEIIEALHHVVLTTIKKVILVSNFLSIFANEVITFNNQSWIFIHCCVVVVWK